MLHGRTQNRKCHNGHKIRSNTKWFSSAFYFCRFQLEKKGKDFKMDVRVSPNEYNPKREFDYLKAK